MQHYLISFCSSKNTIILACKPNYICLRLMKEDTSKVQNINRDPSSDTDEKSYSAISKSYLIQGHT